MSRYYEVTDNGLYVGYVSEEYVFKKFDERVLTGKTDYNFLIGEDEAIDVEPVVRCKDCKHYWKNNPSDDVPVCLASLKDDAFCSEAERREDGKVD